MSQGEDKAEQYGPKKQRHLVNTQVINKKAMGTMGNGDPGGGDYSPK